MSDGPTLSALPRPPARAHLIQLAYEVKIPLHLRGQDANLLQKVLEVSCHAASPRPPRNVLL